MAEAPGLGTVSPVVEVAAETASIDWLTLALAGGVSALVGFLLWAFLPRGVVLTRRALTRGPSGEPVYDSWQLRNNSPLPIRILSAQVPDWEAEPPNSSKAGFPMKDLSVDGDADVQMTFDEFVAEIRRTDGLTPWNKMVVEPGGTLTAKVIGNTMLRIRYRRAGWMGVFERRAVTIHGYP